MRYPRPSRLLGCAGLALLSGAAVIAAAPAAQATPAPKTVEIQVVPQLPNVTFSIEGIAGTTDAYGRAGPLTVSSLTGISSQLALPKVQFPTSDTRVSLDRVVSDPLHPNSDRKLVVELDEDRAVTINLLTPQQKSLLLNQVTSVTLDNSIGNTIKLSRSQLQHQPVWLAASRPHKVTNGVSLRLVSYSVKSVIVRGVNVVNSGQLRFTTDRSLTWPIPVILHSLTIDANDLLAGKPAGSAVQLTYPDGTVRTVPLGPDHRVTVPNLARGAYRVKVDGGLIPLASTIHLSRDQTETELVVTTGDFAEMVALVFAILSVIVAAGVVGRRRRRDRARVDSEPSDASEHSEPEASEEVTGAALV
jgi:hypothetical protein